MIIKEKKTHIHSSPLKWFNLCKYSMSKKHTVWTCSLFAVNTLRLFLLYNHKFILNVRPSINMEATNRVYYLKDNLILFNITIKKSNISERKNPLQVVTCRTGSATNQPRDWQKLGVYGFPSMVVITAQLIVKMSLCICHEAPPALSYTSVLTVCSKFNLKLSVFF